MICPHCKKEIVVKATVHRARGKRYAYFAKRHIESGKAKIRTSVEQLGKCMRCGCEVDGRNEFCNQCKREVKREREKEYYQYAKQEKSA